MSTALKPLECGFCYPGEQGTRGEVRREWSTEMAMYIAVCRHHKIEHQQDEDCTVDPEFGCCEVCGVDHSSPCPACTGRGFHKPECITLKTEAVRQLCNEAACITDPRERTKALKAIQWRFRGPAGQFVGFPSVRQGVCFVGEAEALVFDGRDNETAKLGYYQSQLGPLTIELLEKEII